MKTIDDAVVQIAEDNFKGLIGFIDTLKGRSRKRGGKSHQSFAENTVLDALIDEFKVGAKLYRDVATELIRQQKVNPNSKRLAYYDAMAPIAQHSQLISNITRPFLAVGDKKFVTIEVIEKMIAIIASRLEDDRFFAIPSIDYQFINFNYMADIGAIGLPPDIIAAPSWNLGLLWHEVAGRMVVKARRRGDLSNWVKGLSKILKKAGYFDAYEGVFGLIQAKSGTTINENWQEDWIGEFFEDLYGVEVVGGPLVEALAEALIRHYNRQDENQEHPPRALRLHVALSFLQEPNAETQTRLEGRYGTDLLKLDEYGSEAELRAVAQQITEFYRSVVKQGGFYRGQIRPEEINLAERYRQVVSQFFAVRGVVEGDGQQQSGDPVSSQAGSPDPFAGLPDLRPSASFESEQDILWVAVQVDGRQIAIFFPYGITADAKEIIVDPAWILQLETALYGTASPTASNTLEINNHKFQATTPDPSQPMVAIVVENVMGTKLSINDLDALLKIRFAETDQCCGWWGGG
ncbi:MAG: hypothetical protein GY792_09560 [Gammaproteobacteria bacterium]|nr:hypothetical protein [Gammaproteobacteria bacterium]